MKHWPGWKEMLAASVILFTAVYVLHYHPLPDYADISGGLWLLIVPFSLIALLIVFVVGKKAFSGEIKTPSFNTTRLLTWLINIAALLLIIILPQIMAPKEIARPWGVLVGVYLIWVLMQLVSRWSERWPNAVLVVGPLCGFIGLAIVYLVFPALATLDVLAFFPSVSNVVDPVLRALFAPGRILNHFLKGLIGPEHFGPDAHGWDYIGPLVVLIEMAFCWLVWRMPFARVLKVIGLWDPFLFAESLWRPGILRVWVRFGEWKEIVSRFGRGPTGGWAGLIEVLSNRYKEGDVFLGRPKLPLHLGGLLRPVGMQTQTHICTIAGPGAGKSTGAIIPNLCLHKGSVLCIDPAGELAQITAARRGKGGHGVIGLQQDVYVLDPFGIAGQGKSACYNPFVEMERMAQIDIERPISYAGQIAAALVKPEGNDPYWDEAARKFITALILYVLQGAPEKRNLVNMRRLLMEGEKEDMERGRSRGLFKDDDDAFALLLKKMLRAPDGPFRDAIVGQASTIRRMSPNQRGIVLSLAQYHTDFIETPEIRRTLLTSDFALEDIKAKPMTVYLCLPLNAVGGTEGRWLRMFTMLFIDMMYRAAAPPKIPVLLAIDEFPNLGRLQGIEKVAPTMRKHGVRLWVVAQNIEQFKAVYPESWQTFVGDVEAVQFMGITHPDTVEFLAERLGSHVVMEQQAGFQEGTTRTTPVQYPMLDPNQVSRILAKDRGNQIIWRGDHRPMMLKVCPYFAYMPFWYYSPDPRYREKFNRRFWRSFFRKIPPKPPDPPPPGSPSPPVRTFPEFEQKYPELYNREPDGEDLPPLMRRVLDNDADRRPPKEIDDAPPLPNWRDVLDRTPAPKQQDPPPRRERAPRRTLPPTRPPDGPMEELDRLIGLQAVKDQVRKTVNLVKLGKAREKSGLPKLEITHHLVFTGNPGTGKTTVARIVGRIYKEIGLLKSGHLIEADAGDLVAGYRGQTAPLVKAVIESAMDGVLFIDEAYGLAGRRQDGGDFEAAAIQTLLKEMEDHRDRLVIIVAGYKEEMDTFIASNPGLKSRFKTFIDFADYTAGELADIFNAMAVAMGCALSMDAQVRIAALMDGLDRAKGFGNGRAVRNLWEETLARQADRLAARGKYGRQDMTMIEAEDVPAGVTA